MSINSLYLAEKPSLGREIAKALASISGADIKQGTETLFVGNDAVCWVRGHAYDTAPPEVYNPDFKQWRLDTLPIIPQKWKLLPDSDKKQYISAIKTALSHRPKEIVNVGDAGREGQLIIDEVLLELGQDPFASNVSRVWIQNMTDTGVIKCIKERFPNEQKRGVFEAAQCRQRADWLHGLNLTRLYAKLVQMSGADVSVTVGRVQTPTLKIIVDRDREIENFKVVDHFSAKIKFKHTNGDFEAVWIIPDDCPGLDSEGRLIDKKEADAVVARVLNKTGIINSYDVSAKSKSPPLAFSLSSLQKTAFKKLGFSLEETLKIAQSLYEKKITSYPRTDSEHLPNDVHKEEAAQILQNMSEISHLSDAAKKSNPRIKSPTFNDSKISDHYGIIPTLEATRDKISGLPPDERKVFDIIAKTFIANFYPDYRYDAVTSTISVENDRFKATGMRVTDLGWKAVFQSESKDDDDKDDALDDEDENMLPLMKKGDPATVFAASLDAKKTKPPPYFDDASLVEAMKSIHKFTKDQAMKQRLKESSGIGTEATRTSIINKLISNKHIERKPKGKKTYIRSTNIGRDLIDIVPIQVSSPDMTAIWEDLLESVVIGKETQQGFLEKQSTILKKRVSEAIAAGPIKIKGYSLEPLPGEGEICPVCKIGHMKTSKWPFDDQYKGKRFLRCDNYDTKRPPEENCKHRTRPEGFKERAPIDGEGKTCPSCQKGILKGGIASKDGPNKGRPFLMCSDFDTKSELGCKFFEWADVKKSPDSGKECPDCKKGTLRAGMVTKDGPNKGRSYLMCTEFNKDGGCTHFSWTSEAKSSGPKIKGEGEKCTKCNKGIMVKRLSKKDNSPFLACNNWRANDTTSCDNRIFQNNNKGGKTAGKK